MKIKQSGGWLSGSSKIKVADIWYNVSTLKTKVGNDWQEAANKLVITNIADLVVNPVGWTFIEGVGWQRNIYGWNIPHATKLSSEVMARVQSVSATFTGYNDYPNGGMGENFLQFSVKGPQGQVVNTYMGTTDGNTTWSQGQYIYRGDAGGYGPVAADVVNQRYTYTVPPEWTLVGIAVYSCGYNGNGNNYPFAYRGMRDFEFVLR